MKSETHFASGRKRRVFDDQAQLETQDQDHGGPWPHWVPLGDVLEPVEAFAAEYAGLPDSAFTAEGRRLGDIMAHTAGAFLVDEVRHEQLRGKQLQEWRETLEALSRSLALGSLVPGGAMLWGIWAETVNGETHLRMLCGGDDAHG